MIVHRGRHRARRHWRRWRFVRAWHAIRAARCVGACRAYYLEIHTTGREVDALSDRSLEWGCP